MLVPVSSQQRANKEYAAPEETAAAVGLDEEAR